MLQLFSDLSLDQNWRLVALIAVVFTLASAIAAATVINLQAKRKLRREKILLDRALETMSQGLCMFDADGRIVLCNDRYATMMGLSVPSLKGLSLLNLLIKYRQSVGAETSDAEQVFAQVLGDARKGMSTTKIIKTSAGRTLRVNDQPISNGGGWVSTFDDITEWRQAQEQIAYLAHLEALTGLANRTQLTEKLNDALARAGSQHDGVALHFIDLDRFKSVNDTLGHDGGDFLLKTVAERLREVIRADDVVARLGGDEFVIVQTGVKSRDQADGLARRLVEIMIAPIELKEQTIIATVSVGVAVAPEDGTNPDRLLKARTWRCTGRRPKAATVSASSSRKWTPRCRRDAGSSGSFGTR
jgi:diguanylate cyclase (GGDEF)-like protein/PAS domain S-box-containing protein